GTALKTVDLHVHSRLSKSFDYDHANLERLVRLGRRRGLDGFALTEHIHAVNFWEMHSWLLDNFEYSDGRYRVADDFTVLSGAEVTVGERVDFIVVGPLDELRSLDNAFSPKLSDWNHAPALEFARAARERDLLLLLAHPFRVGKEAAKLDEEIFDIVHAVEVNGRDHGGERQVVALAERHDLPLSGGSDAHFYLQVGIRATIIPGDQVDDEALIRAFETGRTRVHAKPYARSVVELCQEVKRVAKWQGAIAAEQGAIAGEAVA
ncbi:MAG TPA: PHP-associated domain-containing protein, partial [Dehalococcoidia bacterium]